MYAMARTVSSIAALVSLAGVALAGDGATFQLLPEVTGASDISDDGTRLIGYDIQTLTAYLYIDGVPTPLGQVYAANAISGDGTTVVGEIDQDGLRYAARWREGTGWQNLGDLGLGGCDAFRSSAFGTNVDGSIVVGLGWEACKGRGFIWNDANSEMTMLPQSITDSARANAVSDDGTVIGGWQQGNCRQSAAWFEGDATETLLTPDKCGEIFGVSADGAVLYGQNENGFVFEAMYWTEDTGIVYLGNSPYHDDDFVPSAVVDRTPSGDLMVGFSGSFFDGYLATVWTEDGPQDLKQMLLAAGATGLENLTLEYATGVSADGRTIVGQAFDPFTFATTGFVATLPAAGCAADCNGDGELNILDFVCFQNEWTAQSELGDCDANGEYNILDFVCYQNAFTAGCN